MYGPVNVSGSGSVLRSSAGYAWRRIMVRARPGFSEFTRIDVMFSNSEASTCMKPSVANFDAAYAPQYARPRRPTELEVKRTDASCDFLSAGSNTCVSANAAVTFTCITRHHVGTS